MFQNFLPKYSPKEIFQKNPKKRWCKQEDAKEWMQTTKVPHTCGGVYLCFIFEISIWEFITNSKEKKDQFRNKLDFLLSSNLIFIARVACKNQLRNQIDFLSF